MSIMQNYMKESKRGVGAFYRKKTLNISINSISTLIGVIHVFEVSYGHSVLQFVTSRSICVVQELVLLLRNRFRLQTAKDMTIVNIEFIDFLLIYI